MKANENGPGKKHTDKGPTAVSPPDVPLVGRELELLSFLQLVDRLQAGRGRVLSIVGPAGIGKSRLLREAQAGLQDRPVRCLEGDCVPHGQSLFFLPVQQIARAYFGVRENEPAAGCRRKIRAALTGDTTFRPADVELFVALLGHEPSTETFPTEEAQKELVHSFVNLVLHAAAERPLVLCIEDLHWIDHSSLKCLDVLIDKIQPAPVLLCFTARAGLAHGWAGHTHYSQISLAELAPDECRQLAERVAGAALPDDFHARLAEKSGGNPFFASEMARQAIEAGILARRGEAYVLMQPLEDIDFPATIEDAIARRLATLDEVARDLLQKASVIGRSFQLDLLRHVAGDEQAIRRSLEILRQADLIQQPAGSGPDDRERYVFKHGLTHEVAYEGLLVSHRKSFHLQVARTIERLYRESLPEWYEMLAHHFLAGAEIDNALRYLKLSGDKAASLWSAREALDFYDRYLEMYERVPDTIERRRSLHDVQIAMGDLYLLIGQTREAIRAVEAAVRSAEKTGDPMLRGRAFRLLGRAYIRMNEYEKAREHATRARALFEETGSELEAAMAVNDLGVIDWSLGRLDAARQSFRRYLDAAERLGDAYHQANACSNIALIHWNQGELDEAIRYNARALAIRKERGDLRGQIISSNNLGIIYEKRGDFAEAVKCYEETSRLSREIHFAEGLTASVCNIGQNHLLMGNLEEAHRRIEEADLLARRQDDRYGRAIVALMRANLEFYRGNLQTGLEGFAEAEMRTRAIHELQREVHAAIEYASALTHLGDVDRAESMLALAAEQVARHGFHDIQPLVWLAQADLALVQRDGEKAEWLCRLAADAVERQHLHYLQPRLRCLRGNAAWNAGRTAEAESLWRKALAMAERNRDCRTEIQALLGLGQCALEAEAPGSAEIEEVAERLEGWARTRGWRILAWWPAALRGRRLYREGRYAEACSLLGDAVEILEHLATSLEHAEDRRRFSCHPDRADVLFHFALALLMVGREEQAQRYLTDLNPYLSLVWMSNLSVGEELSPQLAARFLLDGLLRAVPAPLALLVLPRRGESLCYARTTGGSVVQTEDPDVVQWAERCFHGVSEATLTPCRELPPPPAELFRIVGEIDSGQSQAILAPVRRGTRKQGWLIVLCAPGDANETTQWLRDVRDHLAQCEDLLYSRLLLLEAKSRTAAGSAAAATVGFEAAIGRSETLRRCLDMARRVAHTDATVLVLGETGTGKELVAQAIHRESPRCDRPFVAINCAAIPESLLASELFGYEKGAFTGAFRQKPGKVECADGGTLFLDEIGDMPLDLQAEILRFLEDGTFDRVGGTETHRVDVRLIAATNRDLQRAVEEGTFRRDLFYRLNVMPIEAPPLRQRLDDLPLLVEHFIVVYAQRYRSAVRAVSEEAMAALRAYPWPGNVRELENVIEHALIVAQGPEIELADLPAYLTQSAPPETMPADLPLEDAVNQFKRQRVVQALERARGNQTEAARMLDIHRTHLHRLIRKLEIPAE